MTLLSELIDIPEQVHKGDFVLRLTEGVGRADETLDNYVVTPQLARCFNDALGFIRGALQSRFEVSTEGVNLTPSEGSAATYCGTLNDVTASGVTARCSSAFGSPSLSIPRGPG